MKRPLLLLICDFLLLSLLQFVSFDEPVTASSGQSAAVAGEVFLARAEQDLVELLQLSLQETAGDSKRLEQEVRQLQQNLTDREQRVGELQGTLEQKEEETRRLEELRKQLEAERAKLEQERARLAEISEARGKELEEQKQNVAQMQEQVRKSEEWGRTSQHQLELLQEEFRNKQNLLDRLLEDRSMLEEERSRLENLRRELEVRWQVAETEKKAIGENLERSRQDLERVQEEKAQIQQTAAVLAEGVQVLGETSREIREEIQDMKTLTASAIFSRFLNAQVMLSWTTERSGLFGTSVREQTVPSLLVSDGKRVVAILHLHQTPLDMKRYLRAPQGLYGKITIGGEEREITGIEQLAFDPRVLAIPVPNDIAERYKDKWINLAKDPLQHESLVLVSREGQYYGEGELRVRPDVHGYLRVPSGLFTRLFGEFSPNRGDWVFNRHGDLIGIMVNSDHAVIFTNLNAGETWVWGEQFNRTETENRMRTTEQKIREMPGALR